MKSISKFLAQLETDGFKSPSAEFYADGTGQIKYSLRGESPGVSFVLFDWTSVTEVNQKISEYYQHKK